MAGLDPAIHVLVTEKKGVDARVKPGHDESLGAIEFKLSQREGEHRLFAEPRLAGSPFQGYSLVPTAPIV